MHRQAQHQQFGGAVTLRNRSLKIRSLVIMKKWPSEEPGSDFTDLPEV